MKKSEIFDAILQKACEICEVSPEVVLGDSKLQHVVEARHLAVQYMRREGLTNDDIARILFCKQVGDPLFIPETKAWKKKSRSICNMFNSYSERCLQSDAFVSHSRDLNEWFLEYFRKK